MTGAGVLVWTLESARIEAGVSEQIDQEIDEFRVFEREGVDPQTGARFDDALRLVTVFLERNVPDDDEMLVGYEGDRPRSRTPNRYGESFLEDPQYLAAVGSLLADGGTREVDDATYGKVWVTAVPVRSEATDGALVIINFLDDEHAELESTLRTYSVVAVLSLGLITLLAALQSGRLLAPLRSVREIASDITTSDLSQRIPETGQRRHHGADPDVQRHARPARGRRGVAATVPRRRRARAADAVDRAARPPRAARRRGPRRGGPHPRRCCSTRWTG